MQRVKLLHGLINRAGCRNCTSTKDVATLSILDLKSSELTAPSEISWVGRRYFQGSSQCKALLNTETAKEGVLFPSEGPGVNYALNWSIAASGVAPKSEAYRNLKSAELKAHGAVPIKRSTGAKVVVKGTPQLSKPAFNKLLKEVTTYLSSQPKIFIHDGALGSSPSSDARTRVLTDSASASWGFSQVLNPTPTRSVDASSFPVTVYAATGFGSESVIAVDPSTSTVIIVGETALGDKDAVLLSLGEASAAVSWEKGALPLAGSLIAESSLVLSPPSLSVNPGAAIANGVVLSSSGVARVFRGTGTEPNLYTSPTSVFLVSSDSTGAIPPVQKLSPQQAAFYFLVGYDGENFLPGFRGEGSVIKPTDSASRLKEILEKTGAQAFLVNAHEGNLAKTISNAALGKSPSGKAAKAADEAAVEAFTTKLKEFANSKFPELPEGISLE